MEEPSTGKVIIKTAAITTAAILLACVVLAVFAFFCFPYVGYKFTATLGMKKSALYFAERYEDYSNIDGLVYCIELDEALYAKDEEKYARKIIDHTEKFFTYEGYEDYFKQIDDYYIENSSPISHVRLYSYYDYVVSLNFKARIRLGEADSMIFRGQATKLNELFPSDVTLMEQAVIYSAAVTALSSGGASLFAVDNDMTDFYNDLRASVYGYADGLSQELEQGTDTLKKLYLLGNVVLLINKMSDFAAETNLGDSAWNDFKTELTFQGKALSKAYDELFSEYTSIKGDK